MEEKRRRCCGGKTKGWSVTKLTASTEGMDCPRRQPHTLLRRPCNPRSVDSAPAKEGTLTQANVSLHKQTAQASRHWSPLTAL